MKWFFGVLVVLVVAATLALKSDEPTSRSSPASVHVDQRASAATTTPKADKAPLDSSGVVAMEGTPSRKACPRRGSDDVNFTAFDLGGKFKGMARTRTLRNCHGRATTPKLGEAGRTNYLSSIYGWCQAQVEGCAPPLEIQSWPACERSLTDYEPETLKMLDYEPTKVRGAPGGWFGQDRLEIYTADATIVIFGRNREELRGAAKSMKSVHGKSLPPESVLPDPEQGALKGELAC